MDVAYFGKGVVGARCLEILKGMEEVRLLGPSEYNAADLWISVHWDKIWRRDQLAIPNIGCVNLHNSYLPWNRGAHACTWAIVDRTPAGATMHWMDEGIDTGDILYQEAFAIRDNETADHLYKRTVETELHVFKVGMEMLLTGNYRRIPQPKSGTLHYKKDFDRLLKAVSTSDCRVIREA